MTFGSGPVVMMLIAGSTSISTSSCDADTLTRSWLSRVVLTYTLDLTSFAGVPHTGITQRSTNACIAVIRASKSTPRGVDARLKHAMVGTPPWLNAPNVGLAALIRSSLGNVGRKRILPHPGWTRRLRWSTVSAVSRERRGGDMQRKNVRVRKAG